MNFESTKKFDKLMLYIRKVAIIVGADIFDPTFKMNHRTIFTASMPISLAMCYIYMLFQNHTMSFVLEGLIMVFLVIQGTTKLCFAVKYAKDFHGLLQRMRNLYVKDARLYENQDSLNKCIDFCLLIYKALAVAYFSVLILYSMVPIFAYFNYNTLQTLFPVHLPYFNVNSPIGFCINIVHQLTFLVLGVIGVLSMDAALLTFMLHYIPFVNLLRIRLNELNAELEKYPYDLNLVRELIRNGIIEHQSLSSYVEEMNCLFSSVLGVQIFTSTGALVLSIFLFIWKKWIVGPCLAFVSVFQLGEFCVFGTVILVLNDKVAYIIYNIYWYMMPAAEQQLVLFMVMKSLRPKELLAANYAKVNVETFMSVLKLTYSFTMMIIELLY